MFSREQATQLRRDHEHFSVRGYRVVAIVQGDAERAAAYRAELELPFSILADQDRSAYRAYGLIQASAKSFLDPKLYAGAIRALLSGALPSKPSGDPSQPPGTFIIDRGGVVRFAKPATRASDIATTTELLSWIEAQPDSATAPATTIG